MTELQVTINNLKEACIAAERLLEKLEKQQEAEKALEPKFPVCFTVVKDMTNTNQYVIGINRPADWPELPSNFKGRACLKGYDLQQIITGLQTLLGDEK